MIGRPLCLVLAAALVGGCPAAKPPPKAIIRSAVLVPGFVAVLADRAAVVDPADDFGAIADHVCTGIAVCRGAIWYDASLFPAGWPMTDRQVGGQVAHFTRNRSNGARRLLFDCRLYPQPSRDDCLAVPRQVD